MKKILTLVLCMLMVCSSGWCAFPTTPVLDAFEDTESPTMTGWGKGYSSVLGEWESDSTNATVNGTDNGFCHNYWLTAYDSDSEAYFTLVTLPDDGGIAYLGIRIVDIGALEPDFYELDINRDDGGGDTVDIERVDDGSATNLDTFSVTLTAGDSFGISAIGSTISAWQKTSAGSWTLLGSVVDATYSAGGFINMFTDNATTEVDNFGGGTYNFSEIRFPTSKILDNFNRANEGPPMTGWTALSTFGGLEVASNVCVPDSISTYAAEYWSARTYKDAEGYFTITTKGATEDANILLRVDEAALNAYIFYWEHDPEPQFGISRADAGVQTYLGNSPGDIAVGDKLGARIVGDLLELWHKPAAGEWTIKIAIIENTYSAAGYISILFSTTDWAVDDFGGGRYNSDGDFFPFLSKEEQIYRDMGCHPIECIISPGQQMCFTCDVIKAAIKKYTVEWDLQSRIGLSDIILEQQVIHPTAS